MRAETGDRTDRGVMGDDSLRRTDEELFAEQTRLICQQFPVALGGALVNVLVLTYALWDVTDHDPLMTWMWVNVLIAMARLPLYLAYRRRDPAPAAARRWSHLYLAGVIASGVAWGAVAVFLFPSHSIVHQVFIALLAGGLSAGSLAAYAPVFWMAPAFFLPALGPVIVRLLRSDNELAMLMGGLVLLYTVLITVIARSLHTTVLTSLRLRRENAGLIDYLTQANRNAEQLNANLTAEIQERAQAERALRESEEKFRGLVENATDGIALVLGGRIVYANQAALDMIGYRREEVHARHIGDFMADTMIGRELMFERYKARIAGQEVPSQYETQMRRSDGTIIDVIISSSLVHLGGQPGVITVTKDITERRKAELETIAAKERAEEATRQKDQFVSLLAHDLRGPLHSLFGAVRLLKEDTAPSLSADQRELLHMVEERGATTLRMIDDLLSISRIQTGKIKLEPRFLDGAVLVGNALYGYRPRAAEKGIAIVNEVPDNTRLYVDADLFPKVINNLLDNAVKFCRRGDRIRVFVPEGMPATLAIADSGSGIDERLLADLFRHEVKTTTIGTAGERGTGLGLPLSQDIMRALGGEITVRSTPGQGSTFYVTLPLLRPKVLVVGADESLALFVRPQLEGLDADFTIVAYHEDAIGLLGRETFHLVIVEDDIVRRDGFDLLEKMRGPPVQSPVPIILIMNNVNPTTMEKAYRLGADDIIGKPLAPNDFTVRLRRFLV